ncbi:MAG: hypothetical protein ACI90V_003567 [Bacillariaceae sp.]|jgi:hypothetical protein
MVTTLVSALLKKIILVAIVNLPRAFCFTKFLLESEWRPDPQCVARKSNIVGVAYAVCNNVAKN